MKQSLFILVAIIMLTGCRQFYEHPDTRESFIGVYNATEFSETYNVTNVFPMHITNNGAEDDPGIIITNFSNLGEEVRARVTFFEFRIPRQRIGDFNIEGSGRLGVNEVIIDYTMENALNREAPINILTATLKAR